MKQDSLTGVTRGRLVVESSICSLSRFKFSGFLYDSKSNTRLRSLRYRFVHAAVVFCFLYFSWTRTTQRKKSKGTRTAETNFGREDFWRQARKVTNWRARDKPTNQASTNFLKSNILVFPASFIGYGRWSVVLTKGRGITRDRTEHSSAKCRFLQERLKRFGKLLKKANAPHLHGARYQTISLWSCCAQRMKSVESTSWIWPIRRCVCRCTGSLCRMDV